MVILASIKLMAVKEMFIPKPEMVFRALTKNVMAVRYLVENGYIAENFEGQSTP